MPALNSCACCGAELRPQDSEGFCTRCLLERGLEESQAETNILRADQPRALLTESEHRTSNAEHQTVRNFGDYELLEEIARGGMGVVYRARQLSLGRIVALKMILAGQFASQQIIKRFRGEVTAAALLQHPNIVAIHDVGIHDGQHYFSMDYVEGQNLSQLVGNRPLPPTKAARYVKLVAEAIHYAHQQGILHRDLKPSNVLVDASDQPRITDFGLAKRLDGESSLTVTGQMLGSPNFMPPEQASSQRGKVGRHSDVYGLGAILYHLLTARPPFQAESFESVIYQVINAEPVSPRLLNSSVPRDLETICVKCLQKEPTRRYQSAQELADELDRFLHDKPIQARPITRPERTWRWCRRKPALAGLGAALVLVFTLGFAGTLWQWRQAMHHTKAEAKQRQLADENRQRAEETAYLAEMHQVETALEDGDLGRGRELIEAHRPRPGQTDLRGFEWRLLWRRCLGDDLYALRGHSNFVNTVKFSPDGKTLATRSGDNQLKVWDLTTRTVRFTITNVTSLGEFTSDGQKFAFGTGDGSVKLCEARTGQPLHTLEKAGELVALLADGKTVATTSEEFVVKLWDIASGAAPFFLPGKGGLDLSGPEFGAGVVITPDGRKLAISNGFTNGITLWDLTTHEVLNSPLDQRYPLTFLQLSPDGKVLATGSFDGLVRFWDMTTGDELPSIQAHSEAVISAAFSSDGHALATASLDQTIKLWDFSKRRQLDTLKGHDSGVMAVAFSADGRQVASGGQDKTVRLWSTGQKHVKQVLSGVTEGHGLIWSPDSRLLASGCQVWDAATLETNSIVPGASRVLAFSDDGQTMVTRFRDGTVKYFNVVTRKVIQEIPTPPPGDWSSAVISPDRRSGAIRDSSPIIRLWDMASGAVDSLTGHDRFVIAVAFSADSHTLISGGNDGVLDIWDVVRRQNVTSIPAHDAARIFSVAISPDGATVATGSTDCTIKLWNLRTRHWMATLNGHRRPIWALAFSPDGNTLASGGGDHTVRLWNVSLRREAAVFREFTGSNPTLLPQEIRSLAFSPDGNNLAATTHGGDLILFRAATLKEATSRTDVSHVLPNSAQ